MFREFCILVGVINIFDVIFDVIILVRYFVERINFNKKRVVLVIYNFCYCLS